MVDLKELRIGNYLNIDGLAAPIGAGWFCASDRGHTLPKHEPIPLTPEWLERMGFIENSIKDYCLGGICVFPYHGEGEWFARIGMGEEGTPLRYAHQLQNLYFALTGKELEIKETA